MLRRKRGPPPLPLSACRRSFCEIVLSKLYCEVFAGYALTQIRKARGLNKKIVNPQPDERKEILDFCFALEGQGSVGPSGH